MKSTFIILPLQLELLRRRIKASGIPWLIVVAMPLGALSVLSWLSISKPFEACALGALVLWQLLLQLSNKDRNEFLQVAFGKTETRKIRMNENLLISLPFMMAFLIHGNWKFALGYGVMAVLSAFYNAKRNSNSSLPTPFGKRPFEFASGFRTTWFLFPIYLLALVMAKNFDNVNFALFGLILSFLTVMSFYNRPEAEYFVWSHSLSPRQFLVGKIKVVILHTSILLGLPILLTALLFPNDILAIGIVGLFGYLVVSTQMLGKYASFPDEMNAAQAVYVGLCIWFPPMVLVVAPYLFSRAEQNLKRILK